MPGTHVPGTTANLTCQDNLWNAGMLAVCRKVALQLSKNSVLYLFRIDLGYPVVHSLRSV